MGWNSKIKEKQMRLLEMVSELPGFEECRNLDVSSPNIGKESAQVVKRYSEQAAELEKDPKYKDIISGIRSMVRDIEYLQAVDRGFFLGPVF